MFPFFIFYYLYIFSPSKYLFLPYLLSFLLQLWRAIDESFGIFFRFKKQIICVNDWLHEFSCCQDSWRLHRPMHVILLCLLLTKNDTLLQITITLIIVYWETVNEFFLSFFVPQRESKLDKRYCGILPDWFFAARTIKLFFSSI